MAEIASDSLAERDAILLLHGFRTGSNFLATILETNRLGRPREYFNQEWQKANRHLSRDALCASAIDNIVQNSAGKIFGCKLPLQDLLWLAKSIGDPADPIGSIARRFRRSTLVVISRRDIFSQAVSLWRAANTGEWFRHRGTERASTAPPFDPTGIYDIYQFLCRDDFLARELVTRSGMAPIRAIYEEFTEDESLVLEVMKEIAERLDPEHCSIDRGFVVSSPHVIQRDEFNLTYRDKFIEGMISNYTGG